MELTYFNPHSQSEADFLTNFVARRGTLDFYLRQLRLVQRERSASHHLIVAPRGYGKTSLLRRIAVAIRAEEDLLERFIGLTFREEQHNVISLDVFWRNCLQALLEAREDEQAEGAEIDELDEAWVRHAPRQTLKREEQDGEPARCEFAAHCRRLRRRPVLLIDNLDSLLAGLVASHQWSLRSILQSDDGPVLLAAASRYPESTHDPVAAFYDFFRVQTLDRLGDDEVMQCLRALAVQRGAAGRVVLDLLDKDPGRVSALNTLAGGNPRTLNVLYAVLETHMSEDVLSQLNAMLDTFTGWYQARTEELPIQTRAVFDALALNWDPMLAATVGEVTGLDTAAVSSHLSRLERLGYAETVTLNRRGRGRNGYQVSERFFNIWYLMRNGPRRLRRRIRFLTVFLQSCFAVSERRTIADRVLAEGCDDPGYALALASSVDGRVLRSRLLEYAEARSTLLGTTNEYASLIRELRDVDDESPRVRQVPSNRPEEALAAYDAVVKRFGQSSEPTLRARVAGALVKKGNSLGRLGRSEEALAAYDAVVERFGESSEPALHEQIARALFNKGYSLGELGRSEEALAVYDVVVERFGESPEPTLRERVAGALVNKGNRLGELGRSEEALAAYDAVVKRFGESAEPTLRERVARALVNKGNRLGELGRSEEALAAYDAVVKRFGESAEPTLHEQIARALFNKGNRLETLGRSEEALAVYDAVVERFGESPEPTLRARVARALVNKGNRLGVLDRSEEALAVYDAVVERFGESSEPALHEPISRALFNKGNRLGELGRSEEALAVYDAVVERFGNSSDPALREGVARALVNKGNRLGELGRSEEALAVYDAVVERFGNSSDPALREGVARALVNKGNRLGELGRSEEALAVYDAVVERFGQSSEPALHEQIARALVNKGHDLEGLRRIDEAEAAFRRAIALAGGQMKGSTLNSLGNMLLDRKGDPAGALQAYEMGLLAEPTPDQRAFLHANCAYALALHGGDLPRADTHAQQALVDGTSISAAGRNLLQALSCLNDPRGPHWQRMFEQIGMAVESDDASLWSDYIDDLQRLLWFIVVRGEGSALRLWMERAQYPMRYAPLYHAVMAAIDGEDHLHKINPETRQPAARIFQGIAERLAAYPPKAGKSRTLP